MLLQLDVASQIEWLKNRVVELELEKYHLQVPLVNMVSPYNCKPPSPKRALTFPLSPPSLPPAPFAPCPAVSLRRLPQAPLPAALSPTRAPPHPHPLQFHDIAA